MSHGNLALTLALAALLGAPLAAQGAPPRPPQKAKPVPKEEPPKPLDQPETEAIVRAYSGAEHWALQAIVLLSLGPDFHPSGAGPLLAALQSKDERLRPYAVELLRAMEPAQLSRVAPQAVVDALVALAASEKNALLGFRTAEVLAKLFPAGPLGDRPEWKRWWATAREGYAPATWAPPGGEKEVGRSVAGSFVERAFDLRDAGLDVAIVIDSTGSMQAAIDSARDAIDDVVSLLAGVAPKLRLGLVHYKDLEDMGDGAQLLVPMTKDQKEVRERLARLSAGGGGDVPESVDVGIEVALDRKMNWNKEANRLILVIGDAPPHANKLDALLKLVKDAHDRPFVRGSKPLSGQREQLRPFITSTIATSVNAKDTFEQIAKAGGGTCVMLEVTPGRGGRAVDPGDPGTAARSVVEHILLLSFGAQHRPQLQRFVRTYFEYRDAGLFK